MGLINYDVSIHRILIICPSGLKYNWLKEIKRWLVRQPALSVGVADTDCFPTTDIVIINFEILHKYEKSLSYYWDLIAIDEGHYLVNRKSRRAQCVFGYKPRRAEILKALEQAKLDPTKENKEQIASTLRKAPMNARRKVILTGTPMVNKPEDLFPLINWLDPNRWSDEFKFKLRYCNGEKTKFGWRFSGVSHAEELKRELRSGVMLRRLKRDVLKDMPPKFRRIVELPADEGAQLAIRFEHETFHPYQHRLETLEQNVELSKAGEDKERYAAAVKALNEGVKVAFQEMARVRHKTAVAKIPFVIERIKQILEEDAGHKMILFAHHLDVINALRKEWPSACVVIGGMSPQEKMAEVNRYQETDESLFFGGLRAASVGITLTASSHVIFLEEDWTPGIMSQAEDRAHRIGQHDNVLAEHWVLPRSLDVQIAQTNVIKQEIMDSILDDVEKAEVASISFVPSKLNLLAGTKPTASDKETATFKAVTEAAKLITDSQREQIHRGLKQLLASKSFNDSEMPIAGPLARLAFITPRQAVIARRFCMKHRNELGAEFMAKIDREKSSK